MNVIEFPSASEFLELTREHLLENEIANAILLSYAENQTQGVESAMTTTFGSVRTQCRGGITSFLIC
jgi:hypothetical protein